MVKQFAVEGHNEALANIRGKRLIATTEIESGKRLASALLKKVTGGESIKTSRKFEHEIEFTPECKVWVSGNHKVEIPDNTLSIWRRVKLVPFTVIIPENEVNPDLFNDLKTEWPGIFNWMLVGCLDSRINGLDDAPAIKTATGEYRNEQDVIVQFVNEKCELAPKNRVAKGDLFKAFELWNEGAKVGRTEFGQRMKNYGNGDVIGEIKSGGHYWTGICLTFAKQEAL